MTMMTNLPSSAAAVPIGRKLATCVGDCINYWLAAWIARQEREATRTILLSFGNRQLRDIGLSRSRIGGAPDNPDQRNGATGGRFA